MNNAKIDQIMLSVLTLGEWSEQVWTFEII